ncbi:L,D-transpeptidase family protein [Chitinispirillales bacterium ANBcel5]|uniref:L,D-transpeptidase family protein n=1 Tax=Cellulosispirillum alkaliphilum TaxID=3039283 RepID=UPI002A582F3B|nr:L,D-transpeptidase family protein [Chitinispirillales bacterium ANBcel5]
MWQKAKLYLIYKYKELQFRYQTWRKARDISRAYSHTPWINVAQVKTKAKRVIFIGSLLGIGLLSIFFLWKAISFIPFSQIYTTVLSVPQRISERMALKDEPEATDSIQVASPTIEKNSYDDVLDLETKKQDSIQKEDLEPYEAFVASIPDTSFSDHIIFADKNVATLFLIQRVENGWDVVREYPMATGEVEGPKEVEGDKKTPQGLYFIIGRKGNHELTPLYGPLAYVLDYPNPWDIEANRTGSGIWIHGSHLGNTPPEFTAGCLAIANDDVLDLGSFLQAGYGIPVVIVCGEHVPVFDTTYFERMINRNTKLVHDYNKHSEMFYDLVKEWKGVWESMDIEHYTTFYSTNVFRSGREHWNSFRERKVRTFNLYDVIEIEIDHFVLTELSETEATVKFSQIYSTNLNRFVNGKRLIFVNDNGEWKITQESTFPKQELFL